MGLFTKKKEKTGGGGGNCNSGTMRQTEIAKNCGATIKVLGSGCTKCNQLEAAVKEALGELGMAADIEHITDFAQIAAYGVMSTPALVVNGKVVSYGKVLKRDEVIELLQKTQE